MNKVPPHSIEHEQGILAACMLGDSQSVINNLSPTDFYKPAHQKIFSAIKSVNGLSTPVEIISVMESLRTCGDLEECGGAAYLNELTNNVPAASSLDYFCKVIKDKSAKRRMIERCAEIANQCYQDGDIGHIFEKSKALSNSANLPTIDKKRCVDISNVYTSEMMLASYRKYVDGLKNNRFITGIREIDMKIRGVAGGETLFIIARAGAYKTALLQNMLRNYVNNSAWGTIFFSLEMPVPNVTERYLQQFDKSSGREIEAFYSNRNNDCIQAIERRFNQELKRFFTVDTKVSLSDMERYAKLVEDHYQTKIGVIGVDYMGLVQESGEKEYDQISKIARGSKDLAKFLNIPVIVLSQINRKGESGQTEVSLDMGRGSGAIEEAADFMLGMWQDNDGLLICKILKNRKGPAGGKWSLVVDKECFLIGPDAFKYETPKNRKNKKID